MADPVAPVTPTAPVTPAATPTATPAPVPPDLSGIDITTALNAPANPASFIIGKTDLASGSGHWTITPLPGAQIAISDPGVEGQFPDIELAQSLQNLGTNTMTFMGPVAPTPPDAIGFTSKLGLFAFTNDTGSTLQNIPC